MKNILLFFAILPFFSFSQNLTNAMSISGGAEYHDANTHAWNTQLTYNRRFQKSSRFWSEFGLNYSILEYKGDSGIKLDTTPPYPSPSLVGIATPDGYVRIHSSHYARTSALRMNIGINYTIIDKEKFRVSTGLNVLNQLLLREREHGQRIWVPGYVEDSLDVIYSQYSSEETLTNTSEAVTILLQPHVDVAVSITDKLWFTSRIAYYWEVLPYLMHSRAQLNLGLRFEW
ncbi:MAG: hypothetical protein HRT58_22480 [Crocinitomicaceae bacterium]|nr:hypothetical protein [Flavobacteriales bacterium]NQZ38445.1 hypothetical protein [Crocinitomicaceae bacterium]